tara:strand:+ start:875 stop:1186 length:312 start_codon:yes stop_codon:yes gene_type:complete
MKNQTTITKIVLAVLFVLCLADMPYGYFQFVRFLGMIGFAFLAFDEFEKENKGWSIFYIASAVLINPIFKISLGRELWNIIDIIWAIILVVTIFHKRYKVEKN